MKVAIIGGGLSGLSCGFYLEQLGFKGDIDIYERKEGIGVGNVWIELISEVFHRPIDNYLKYIYENYNLKLKPVGVINNSINYGPSKSSHTKNLSGYIVARGGHPLALEKQIYEQMNTKVKFNSYINVDDIRDKYDKIVLATGDISDIPKEVKVRVDRYAHFYMAMVKGNFNRDRIKFWLNNDYAPRGYGFMLPLSDEMAEIALVTPKREFDLQKGWDLFVKEVFNNNLNIHELHELRNVTMGEPEVYTYDNIIFTGLCAGTVTPAMGYGLHMCILSGFYAAESIVLGKDYMEQLKDHIKEYKMSLALRTKMESLDNDKYDILVDNLDDFLIRNVLKYKGVNILKPFGELLAMISDEKKYSVYEGNPKKFQEETLYKEKEHNRLF